MGRVFTWEEVSVGKVPTPETITSIAEFLRLKLAANASVAAALLCGSVLHGTHNRRSDVDCVFLFDEDHREQAMGTMSVLYDHAAQQNVVVEFIPMSTEMAKAGLHGIGPLFLEHLQIAANKGGVIKASPLDRIRLRPCTLHGDAMSYLAHKLDKLQKKFIRLGMADAKERAAILQKALEAPAHVARKIIQVFSLVKPESDELFLLMPAYFQLVGKEGHDKLKDLMAMDMYYSSELELQMSNIKDEGRYAEALTTIEEKYPTVVEFVLFNARLLMRGP
jgi:hypothetical protein